MSRKRAQLMAGNWDSWQGALRPYKWFRLVVEDIMDFMLSEEQRMVQQMVREFAQKEIAPLIKESDRSGEMNPIVLPRLGELGILGMCLPVRYGGQGMDYISLGLACEEAGCALSPVETGERAVSRQFGGKLEE